MCTIHLSQFHIQRLKFYFKRCTKLLSKWCTVLPMHGQPILFLWVISVFGIFLKILYTTELQTLSSAHSEWDNMNYKQKQIPEFPTYSQTYTNTRRLIQKESLVFGPTSMMVVYMSLPAILHNIDRDNIYSTLHRVTEPILLFGHV